MIDLGNAEARQRLLLNTIAGGETPPLDQKSHGYDELFGGARFKSYAAFPKWAGVTGPWGITHAAGRYQFQPVTWSKMQIRLHLPDFGPASQDAAAWVLACDDYKRRSKRSLDADLATLTVGFMIEALHPTWASVNRAFVHRLIDLAYG